MIGCCLDIHNIMYYINELASQVWHTYLWSAPISDKKNVGICDAARFLIKYVKVCDWFYMMTYEQNTRRVKFVYMLTLIGIISISCVLCIYIYLNQQNTTVLHYRPVLQRICSRQCKTIRKVRIWNRKFINQIKRYLSCVNDRKQMIISIA